MNTTKNCPYCTEDPDPVPIEVVPLMEDGQPVLGVCQHCAGAAMLDRATYKMVRLTDSLKATLHPFVAATISHLQHSVATSQAERN